MKSLGLVLLLASAVPLLGCNSDTAQPIINNNGPVAPTTVLRAGTLTPENGTPTAGMLNIVKDANNDQWVTFSPSFASSFATGTVAVYLAKSSTSIGSQRTLPPPPVPNILAVGFVGKNGEQSIKIPGSSTGFGYVVLYCETAEINFGHAALN